MQTGTGHSARVVTLASGSVDEAVAAARTVSYNLATWRMGALLHASNNVVFGTNTLVAKVTRNEAAARTEYALSRHASENGAPTLAPVIAPAGVGDFTVVVWPRAWPHESTSGTDAARALHQLLPMLACSGRSAQASLARPMRSANK